MLLLSRKKVGKSGIEEAWMKERNASVLTHSHFIFAAASPVSAPIVGKLHSIPGLNTHPWLFILFAWSATGKRKNARPCSTYSGKIYNPFMDAQRRICGKSDKARLLYFFGMQSATGHSIRFAILTRDKKWRSSYVQKQSSFDYPLYNYCIRLSQEGLLSVL